MSNVIDWPCYIILGWIRSASLFPSYKMGRDNWEEHSENVDWWASDIRIGFFCLGQCRGKIPQKRNGVAKKAAQPQTRAWATDFQEVYLKSRENEVHVSAGMICSISLLVKEETIRLNAILSKVLFVFISLYYLRYIYYSLCECVYILPPSLCSPILAYISRFCIMKANWKCSPPHAVDESQLLCSRQADRPNIKAKTFPRTSSRKIPNRRWWVRLRGMVNNKQ